MRQKQILCVLICIVLGSIFMFFAIEVNRLSKSTIVNREWYRTNTYKTLEHIVTNSPALHSNSNVSPMISAHCNFMIGTGYKSKPCESIKSKFMCNLMYHKFYPIHYVNFALDANEYFQLELERSLPARLIYFRSKHPLFAATLDNIYEIYDDVIRGLHTIRQLLPANQVIVLLTEEPAATKHDRDMLDLHKFLLETYIIDKLDIFVVMTNVTDIKSPEFQKARCSLEKQLVLFNEAATQRDLSGVNLDRLLLETSLSFENYRNSTYFKNYTSQSLSLKALCKIYLNSRKYKVECMPRPKMLLPVLITGLGGSGTHYISRMMNQSLQLDMPHETLGLDGSVSWLYAVNDVLWDIHYPHHAMLPHRTLFEPRYETVIHIVRDPGKHISAFTAHTKLSYEFVFQAMISYIKLLPNSAQIENSFTTLLNENHCNRGQQCRLLVAAYSWLLWNSHIEQYADTRIQVESIDEGIGAICPFISSKHRYSCSIRNFSRMKNSPPSLQTSKESAVVKVSKQSIHPVYTLMNINSLDTTGTLVKEIVKLSAKYGYDFN